ncbi:MAG: tyrosine-type recombinase/integrase [Acidimicrobiales bacterium]
MRGSLREKGGTGTWELRVFLGRDARGRVRQRSVTFRGTKRAAERELNRLVADLGGSLRVGEADEPEWGPATTVNEAVEAWKANGWADLSPTTRRRYEGAWAVHVRDSIGRKPIASISSYQVERYYRSLKDAGLSEGSVRYVRALLHRACKLARKWSGAKLANPFADAELPDWSLTEKSPEVRSPSLGEVVALLRAAEAYDQRFAAFVRLVAATGIRRGEACAVRWGDVDAEGSSVRIDESIVAAAGGAEVKAPKTRASIRRVAVDADTLAALEELRSEQRSLAEATGTTLDTEGFVFSSEPGGAVPPHPDAMSHAFAKVRTEAKVASDVHLHSLRRFQATVLDRVISERQARARDPRPTER